MIAKEILKNKEFKVKVLSHSTSASDKKSVLDELKSEGSSILKVNYNDLEDLKKALEGVQVVISALSGPAIGKEQANLVNAAKAVNAKRFIPSEYGIDTALSHPEPFVLGKVNIQKAIKESGLEYTFFYTGFFIDYIFQPFFGFDLEKKCVKIVGEGNAPVSFTHRADVAKYIVQSLLHPEKSRNKEVRLASTTVSLNEVVEVLKKKGVLPAQGAKVEYLKKSEVVSKIKAAHYGPETFPEQLQVIVEEGRGQLKNLNNVDYPEVHPITLEKYFESYKC